MTSVRLPAARGYKIGHFVVKLIWPRAGQGVARMPTVVLLRSWKLPWLVLLSPVPHPWGEGALAPI
jgi:hypothetical protein